MRIREPTTSLVIFSSVSKTICLSSSSRIAFLFFGLFIFLNTTTISTSYNGNETDYLALMSFKSMITQDPYGALRSWNNSFHFCDWNGVSCGKRHRRVIGLNMTSQGLVGSLSPHVGNLSFLRVLWLVNNTFQGSIPHELGHLFRLRELNFRANKFNGVIPTNMSRCSNLEKLRLSSNNLVGKIPMEFSLLSGLIVLSVGSNNLTGQISVFLGNLTSMEAFSAFDNPLGGSIPDTLGHCRSLRRLNFGNCSLYGIIPHSIYNLSLLASFILPMNHLTGSVPPSIGAMFPLLEHIHLRNNELTGLLPSSISNCSNLKLIDLAINRFSGKLEIDFANLRDIEYIILADNYIGSKEADDINFIDTLKNCSKLQGLEIAINKFQGKLPNSIGNFSSQLFWLNLQRNQFYGNLPSSIGNLVGLSALYLENNRFIGKIPSTIGKLQKLQRLVLGDNQISGEIPDSIGNLSLLNLFVLGSNRLEGSIPSSLGNCHNLLELYFDWNNLNGKIPKQLLQLSSLSIALVLSHNNLSGLLPSEVERLKALSVLDLSDNKLSGNIPSSLSGCTSLVHLNLKGNLFEGMIPSSLSSLRGVEIFDLSRNNLSGHIPHFLEEFSLQYLNISFNDFEGEVPIKGVFTNASAFSVFGNKKLCGGLIELGLPKCKREEKHKKWFFLVIIVISIAISLLAVLCFVYSWCKKKIKGQQSQSSMDEQFLKVSYNQLLKATNDFCEANLIGEGFFGSVYKGILDRHDNKIVAVKVLNLQNPRARKSFITECEAWRNIRHRNLLKIITSCSSLDFQGNDFKALVYEFMPNGSLDDWLHSSASTSRLNLLQRINILIDVACAVDYLHNCCQAAIVHCDIKPSNVLLDNDMIAHVGDFGLARLLQIDSNQNNLTSGIRGTIGYVAPEYGFGSEMTTKGDVYGFGILLLEVMTGKRPTDIIFNEGFNLHKFANIGLANNVTDIVDQELLYHHEGDANSIVNAKKIEECVKPIVEIGVACSMDSPSRRMNVKNALYELQNIREAFQGVTPSSRGMIA